MKQEPQIVFGMPVFNEGTFLVEALDSLLNQTYGDFRLVVLDNQSNDSSATVIRDYAQNDSRIMAFRNLRHQGMIEAFRAVYELAHKHCLQMKYFAWAAGHDRWEPEWLEKLIGGLERCPDVCLAYPMTAMMNRDSEVLGRDTVRFDTWQIQDPFARFRYVCRHLRGAGNRVYGLFRSDALEKAGIYRDVLMPDRFLLLEMSAMGGFKQIDEVLWYRRLTKPPFLKDQRRSLFGPAKRPFYVFLPAWVGYGFNFIAAYIRTKENIHKKRGLPVWKMLAILMATQCFHCLFEWAACSIKKALCLIKYGRKKGCDQTWRKMPSTARV